MRTIASLSVVILCLAAGCGGKSDTLKRVDVSGKVTYKSEPIKNGDITFVPAGGSNVPPSSGTITDGAYKLNSGLAAGTYAVQIRAYKPFASKELSPGGLDRPQSVGIPSGEQTLPEKYNTKSTIEQLTIDGKATSIEKNYDLKE